MGTSTGLNLAARSSRTGTAVVFCSYLLVSALWSWPTAIAGGVVHTRQFDLYPSLWLLGAAPDVGTSLFYPQSAWPFGESLARVDSYVLVLLGHLTHGWLDPVRLVALLAWMGPAVNATFAERCAVRAFHVPRPWSWVAGVTYGFSGIAATALLEGHVHHVLNPWLPLLLQHMWTLRDGSTRWQAGLRAGVYWSLCLFTSGYFGILGAIIVVAAAGLGRITVPLVGAGLVALPAGLTYVQLFTAGGRAADHISERRELWYSGANTLASLAAGTPSLDLTGHSIGASAGFTLLWLLLLAPVVLHRERGWRDVWALAVLFLLLTFGASFRLDMRSELSVASPAALLTQLPGVEFFRFPIRFAWGYTLFGGMIAARVMRELSAPLPRVVVGITWLLVLGDAFVSTGMPWRLPTQLAEVPSAYEAAGTGPILDLYALPADRSRIEGELRARALSCYYQSRHRRPILELCIGTSVDSPREVVDAWLTRELLDNHANVSWIRERIAAFGLGSVAVHATTYRPSDRALLLANLESILGPPLADTTDGGERVVLFGVPADPAADPVKTYERMKSQVDVARM